MIKNLTKKQEIIILATVVVAIGLFVAYWFAGRSTIADITAESIEQDSSIDEKVDDKVLEEVAEAAVLRGQFVDIDAIHKGTGSAEIAIIDGEPLLIFGDNFQTTDGPDLVVYLSPNNVAAGEELGDFVTLGDLKLPTGRQAYNAPENYEDFKSVVVWCRAFGVLFTAADLTTAD